jgi:gas vesicle protein
MDAALWGFIGTLAGAVVGATASISTTAISSRNASRLQQNSNYLERIERARAFQRDNLLELQDTLQDCMRLMGRAHHEDVVAYRESGHWGKSMLSDEVNQNTLLSNRKLAMLTERVSDNELRSELKKFSNNSSNLLFAKSEIESDESLKIASSEFSSIMEKLGEVLRKNY